MCRCSSAQRLSASLESSHLTGATITQPSGGAQRLSASLESSLRQTPERVIACAVLNAFRHHWNLHSVWLSRFGAAICRSDCGHPQIASPNPAPLSSQTHAAGFFLLMLSSDFRYASISDVRLRLVSRCVSERFVTPVRPSSGDMQRCLRLRVGP